MRCCKITVFVYIYQTFWAKSTQILIDFAQKQDISGEISSKTHRFRPKSHDASEWIFFRQKASVVQRTDIFPIFAPQNSYAHVRLI